MVLISSQHKTLSCVRPPTSRAIGTRVGPSAAVVKTGITRTWSVCRLRASTEITSNGRGWWGSVGRPGVEPHHICPRLGWCVGRIIPRGTAVRSQIGESASTRRILLVPAVIVARYVELLWHAPAPGPPTVAGLHRRPCPDSCRRALPRIGQPCAAARHPLLC